jgi:hypothetical protein
MADSGRLALIHAEIDGELDGRQRAELARALLADPEIQVLREDLRRVCAALDALEEVHPPQQLRQGILAALPQPTLRPARSWWSGPRLRYAAVIVAMLTAGTVVYETVHGPKPFTTDVVGTMGPAGERILDAVRLEGGPVAGLVSLYRDRAGLGLKLELSASEPLDVLVASAGHTLQIKGVGSQDKPGQGKPGVLTVGLPGARMGGQTVEVTFLMAGRQVGSATLRTPVDP